MGFFKDDPALKTAEIKPAIPIKPPLPSPATTIGSLAKVYNDVGGLIDTLATRTGIDPMAVLAVWLVESGGHDFAPGQPVLRFEVHKFWRYWGKGHAALFDQHFRFGGHGAAGASHQNHAFRLSPQDPWMAFHGGAQALEYQVFTFATQLADKESACLSSSFGGPQIMGFNHDACGYATAASLFDRFGQDARWQVLGFFDFCRTNGLIRDIHDLLWIEFGQSYNGDGAVYGPKLKAVFDKKSAFNQLPR
jgi:hypothetical protein